MALTPGKYLARCSDYGFGATQANLPQIVLQFDFKNNLGEDTQYLWQGSLKPGTATNITMAVLKALGFDKTKHQLIDLADGAQTGVLDLTREVEITVEEEHYQGKTYMRITRVAKPGGLIEQRRVTKDEAAEMLRRLESVQPATPAAPTAAAPTGPLAPSEVPF